MDDSGIASDGEGSVVALTPTTPASSRPSSPGRVEAPTSTTVIDLSVQVPIAKPPRPRCYTCNTDFSGPKQFQPHIKGKKHKIKLRNSHLSSSCKLCGHCFTSNHNLNIHKCEDYMKKEKFYKLQN